jgi:sensor histidine kinase YesM
MSNHFFPRDRTFWLYHSTVLFVVCVIQGFTILAWAEKWLFDVAVYLLWMPFFTLGLLSFRHHYKGRDWHRLSMGKLIPLGLTYAGIIALGTVLASLAFTLPVFWDYLFTEDFLIKHNTTVPYQLGRMIIGTTLSTHLFASAWVFIYISVTGKRRISEAELSNLRLQNSLREAQLSSLANQLNPHFLFNALNNIRFMIHENPQHADRMITELSEMLRYSLESSKKDKVMLREEIEMIDRYIDIVKIQLEERLKFSMAIPRNLHEYLMPPMMLQMLVENAIKHGLDNLQHGGRLDITGSEDGDYVVFQIKNDCAIGNNKLQSNMGIGLANIEQRLTLLYGDQASLAVTTVEDEFTVQVRIPKDVNL